ncbi:MAG: NUDIX hydrolase [Gemmataceae bacterium]|nr:NUDIX hydrolase [Gemmataceae bacterium]
MTPHYQRYVQLKQIEPGLFPGSAQDPYRLIMDDAEVRRLSLDDKCGVVFENQYIRVLNEPVIGPSGPVAYLRILGAEGASPGVCVLSRYEDRFVFIDIFRHPARGWLLELPRGFGDPGCSPEDNVRREVREEIQGEVDAITLFGPIYPDSGISGKFDHVVFATLSNLDAFVPSEGIRERLLLTAEEIDQAICSGRIRDGFTLSALSMARAKRWM